MNPNYATYINSLIWLTLTTLWKLCLYELVFCSKQPPNSYCALLSFFMSFNQWRKTQLQTSFLINPTTIEKKSNIQFDQRHQTIQKLIQETKYKSKHSHLHSHIYNKIIMALHKMSRYLSAHRYDSNGIMCNHWTLYVFFV